MEMRSVIKQSIKRICRSLGIDLTQNMRYDRLTSWVIRNHLKHGGNAIDIGAHTGEILAEFLIASPTGKHVAIEPIPELASHLRKTFGDRCTIHACALSDQAGEASFQIFRADKAYSGLRRRDTGNKKAEFDEVTVPLHRLDDIISQDHSIDLIKIDVEGGEFDVLRGAEAILRRNHPLLIFECGLGASEYYGTTPEDLFDFLAKLNYSLRTLPGFAENSDPLSKESFEAIFRQRSDYYFVAN